MILPLTSFIFSRRASISDFLIPVNLNLESLGLSSKKKFKKILFPWILVAVICTSENKPCSHNFSTARVMSSPGTIIVLPIFKPEIWIRVLWSRCFVPLIVIPPNTYCLGFAYEIGSQLVFKVAWAWFSWVNPKIHINSNKILCIFLFNLFTSFSKPSFSVLIIYYCLLQMFSSKIGP